MRDIETTTSGLTWRELETADEALSAGRDSETAVGHIFSFERKAGGTGRYFTLQETSGRCVALCRVPDGGGWEQHEYKHSVVVARMNGNPFPAYRDAIQVLAGTLGISMDESCYLNRRQAKDYANEAEGDADEQDPTP